jgi:hypothetical protein
MISSVLSLHPDYIVDILTNLNSGVKEDVELILKLDKYTKENNERNYSYKLFTKLSNEIHSI